MPRVAVLSKQNVFLSGNPQITFWKMVYKRHTQFAIVSREIHMALQNKIDNTHVVSFRSGHELLYKMFLKITLPRIKDNSNAYYTDSVGHAIIDSITLVIGNFKVDVHYGEWYEILDELTTPAEKQEGYHHMIGKFGTYNKHVLKNNKGGRDFYIPLRFFFNEHPSLVFPLNLIKKNRVDIIFNLRNLKDIIIDHKDDCFVEGNDAKITQKCFADFVLLQREEMAMMHNIDRMSDDSDHSLYYIIPRLQVITLHRHTPNSTSRDERMTLLLHKLSGNVKELIWVFHDGNNHNGGNRYFQFSNERLESMSLSINGEHKYENGDSHFFSHIQPLQHHTRIPTRSIYCYSFSLNPEEITQPNGTCNFTNVRLAHLDLVFNKVEEKENKKIQSITMYASSFSIFSIDKRTGDVNITDSI